MASHECFFDSEVEAFELEGTSLEDFVGAWEVLSLSLTTKVEFVVVVAKKAVSGSISVSVGDSGSLVGLLLWEDIGVGSRLMGCCHAGESMIRVMLENLMCNVV